MTNENTNSRKYAGIIAEDPTLKPFPYGATFNFEQLFLNSCIISGDRKLTSDEIKKPLALNSALIKGALIGVCIDSGDGKTELVGTAFIIGAGIAVTATHVIKDVQDDLVRGKARCLCIAFRDDELVFWELSSISCDDSDIAFLSINPLSNFPSNMTYYQFGLTTLAPKVGDTLRIIGYKQLKKLDNRDPTNEYSGVVDVYVTEGKITEFYLNGRDKTFLQYSCLEVDCGALSGMSGGVAIDQRGFVVGVVSTSYGEEGPTYVSWIVSAIRQQFSIDWPKGDETKTSLLIEAIKANNKQKRVLIENYNSNLDASGNIIIPKQAIGRPSDNLVL